MENIENLHIEEHILGLEIGGTSIKALVFPLHSKMTKIMDHLNKNETNLKIFNTHTNPEETIKELGAWASNKENKFNIKKVCISMFGPLDLKRRSKDFGKILNTPKPGWKDFNVVQSLSHNFNLNIVDIEIDIDVGCAAYLEYKLGGHNVESIAYITIGTGVGVGVVINGEVIKGLMHPEGGHIRVAPYAGDNFIGVCPVHGNCLEGLVTNNALMARKQLDSVQECSQIKDDDEVWDCIAYYIGQLCVNLLYLLSVEKIVIGGGIINREILLLKIRKHFLEINNNYIDESIINSVEDNTYIDRTYFKNYSGILSAFSLLLK